MSSDFFIEVNFARSLLVKILLSYSLSHTVRCRQHSIERDADFHVVIKCSKKSQLKSLKMSDNDNKQSI